MSTHSQVRWYRFPIVIFACALQFFALPAHAEPSAKYQKCLKEIDRHANTHTRRANKLRDKYERKIARRIADARKTSVNQEAVEGAADQVRNWLMVDGARNTHVEKLIHDVSELISPDSPDFKCLDNYRVLKVYENNLEVYRQVLEQMEKDVVQRVGLENLDEDEGLVIISYHSNVNMYHVLINRRDALGNNIAFSPFFKGQYYRVLKAKAGTYVWDAAWEDLTNARRKYSLGKFDFGFTVKPGVINYAGTFSLESRRTRYFTAFFNDRPTISLKMLEARYPELIGRYDISNGLNPDDRFTDFYLQEKARIARKSVTGNE